MSMTAIFISISSLILVINASFSCPSNTSKCNITLTNFTLDKINALPNPFKGFVPYSSLSPSRIAAFPTSMENKYFAMKDLMQGPNQFNL